jgi:hypothetical protein
MSTPPSGTSQLPAAPSTLLILGAGVLALIGSFLDVIEIQDQGYNAWDSEGTFPLWTLPTILGVLVAVHLAIVTFAKVNMPDDLLGLTWNQVYLALTGFCVLVAICLLIGEPLFEIAGQGAETSRSIGFWLILIASAGAFAGAIMRQREATA